MQSLRQPGPVHPKRIDCFRGEAETLRIHLKPGVTLNEAITAPLVEAGFQCATINFKYTALGPFQYVIPAVADDASHVAYFSAPRMPLGTTRIEQANATFGWTEGRAAVHCHAAWIEPDGQRRGGHILAHETIVTEPGEAIACGFRSIRIEAKADPETNFTLFQPHGTITGQTIVARIKPNQDIITAIGSLARDAIVVGGLGSLIGARFTDGSHVNDHATEVLVREGCIRDGRAALNMLVVDMQGHVHNGWLRRCENPVCITFDIVLQVTA